MELLNELGLDIGAAGGFIAVFALVALTVLLSMSAYAAQKWAYKTYLETRRLNEKLGKLLELVMADAVEPPPTATSAKSGKTRREPTLGNADI